MRGPDLEHANPAAGLSVNSLDESQLLPRHVAVILDGNGRWASEQENRELRGIMRVRRMFAAFWKRSPRGESGT